MKSFQLNDPINDSVILAVSPSGKISLHTFVGSFSGDAAHDLQEDVARLNKDQEVEFPPNTFWQVDVEYDEGDPSVGLPALGYVLRFGDERQLPWKAENTDVL